MGDECDNTAPVLRLGSSLRTLPDLSARRGDPPRLPRSSASPSFAPIAGGGVSEGRGRVGAPCRSAPEGPARRPRSCGTAGAPRAAPVLAWPVRTRSGRSQRQLPEAGGGGGLRGRRGEGCRGITHLRPPLAPGPPLRSRLLSGLRPADPAGARGPRSSESRAVRRATRGRRTSGESASGRCSRSLPRRAAQSGVRVRVWASVGVRGSAVCAQGRAGGVAACSGASVTFSAFRSKSATLEFIPPPHPAPPLHMRLPLSPPSHLIPKEIPLVVREYSQALRLT